MKAVILAGGTLEVTPRLARLASGADLVVAADGGLRHAAPLGLEPHAVVGDFDSVSRADLARYPRAQRVRYPTRKDELDLELAASWAVGCGAAQLLLLGAFGSRLDQTLAALLFGARLRRAGLGVTLHTGIQEAHPLVAGDALAPDLPPGTRFSLLSLEGTAVVTVGGAEYPLDRAELPFGVGLGISNWSTGGTRVRVERGLVVLIVEWREDGPEEPDLG